MKRYELVKDTFEVECSDYFEDEMDKLDLMNYQDSLLDHNDSVIATYSDYEQAKQKFERIELYSGRSGDVLEIESLELDEIDQYDNFAVIDYKIAIPDDYGFYVIAKEDGTVFDKVETLEEAKELINDYQANDIQENQYDEISYDITNFSKTKSYLY